MLFSVTKVRGDGEVDRYVGEKVTQQQNQAILSTFSLKTGVILGIGVCYHLQLSNEVIGQLLEGELKSSSSWECDGEEKPRN